MSKRTPRGAFIETLEPRTLLAIAEPNNELATAFNVNGIGGFAGLQTFADVISTKDPADYYRLNLPSTNKRDLTVTLRNLTADLRVSLIRDVNNNQQEDPGDLIVTSGAGTGTKSFTRQVFQSGTFYVLVFNPGANSSAYTLDLFLDSTNDVSNPLTRVLPGTGVHSFDEGLNTTDDQVDLFRYSGFGAPGAVFSARLVSANALNYRVELFQDTSRNGILEPAELVTTSAFVDGVAVIAPRTLSNSNTFIYARVSHITPSTDSFTLQSLFDFAGSTPATANNFGNITRNLRTVQDEVGTTALPTTLDPIDFYRIEIEEPGTAILSTLSLDAGQSPSSFQVAQELFRDANNNGAIDAGESFATASTSAVNGTAIITKLAPVGTYFLKVTGAPFPNYTLAVEGDTVHPQLPGETIRFSKARDLGTLNGQVFDGEALSDGDIDAYRFTLPRAGRLKIDLDSRTAAAFGVDTDKDDIADPGEMGKLIGDFSGDVPAGTYLIQLRSTKGPIITGFSINADYAPNTAATGRDLGTLGAFTSVQDNVADDDPDYYRFKVNGTQTLTAALTGFTNGNNGDLNLALFQDNLDGTFNFLTEVAGTTFFTLLQRTIPTGSYAVELTASDRVSSNYTLGLSTGDNDDSIPEVEMMENTRMNVGQTKDFTLGNSSDVDLIRLNLDATGDNSFTIDVDSRNGSNVDTFLRIFDIDGNQIATNDDGTAPGESASKFSFINFTMPASIPNREVAYIGISSSANKSYNVFNGSGDAGGTTSGAYTISITKFTPPALGSISGNIYNDLDADGVKDANESGIAGRTVYIDLDNDNTLDANETRVTTNASGQYTLSNLAAGTYKVRQQFITGWSQTFPTNNFGLSVALTTGQAATGKSFFTRPTPTGTGRISGQVFQDFNRNTVKDSGDSGIAGVVIYLDLDNDSILDTNEQRVLTDSSGNYNFANLGAGTYKIRMLLPGGFVQTTPTNNFGNNATLSTGSSVVTGKNFGADN